MIESRSSEDLKRRLRYNKTDSRFGPPSPISEARAVGMTVIKEEACAQRRGEIFDSADPGNVIYAHLKNSVGLINIKEIASLIPQIENWPSHSTVEE